MVVQAFSLSTQEAELGSLVYILNFKTVCYMRPCLEKNQYQKQKKKQRIIQHFILNFNPKPQYLLHCTLTMTNIIPITSSLAFHPRLVIFCSAGLPRIHGNPLISVSQVL